MRKPFVGFHFGLVQDVAVLRPLARLAAKSTTHDLRLLIANGFKDLDHDGFWMAEIQRLGSELGVEPFTYESPFDCLRELGPGRGMLIAGSESDAKAHRAAHELFRSMPGRIRTVTLQHGFECVGFLHNKRHDATAGRAVRFAADIAVSWFDVASLHSVAAEERSKIFVAGPTMMIERAATTANAGEVEGPLICENLHSVRFVNGALRETFLDTFQEFARRLDLLNEQLVLRPHPAGRFTERNGIVLPSNVKVSRAPLYDVDLGRFAYVISAPSTILFDFILAGVPVAAWVDPDGRVDCANFSGLPQVSTAEDWWRFHWAAKWRRTPLIEAQDAFLRGLALPDDVPGRYQTLLAQAA